jgi:hypothetical protein
MIQRSLIVGLKDLVIGNIFMLGRVLELGIHVRRGFIPLVIIMFRKKDGA